MKRDDMKNKIATDDIYELITQDNDVLVMKTNVEVISGNTFKINTLYNEKLKGLLGDYMYEITEITEELYRCNSKEIWKKVRTTGYVNYAMIEIVVAKNDIGNHIKLSVPCLKIYQENIKAYKNTEEENSKIKNIKDILDKLEEITVDLTEILHTCISEKVHQLISASKGSHFEILVRSEGNKLLYEGFVASGLVEYSAEEFYLLHLIKNEKVLKKIECELDEELSFLSKKSLIKIIFDYENGVVKDVGYYPVLKVL